MFGRDIIKLWVWHRNLTQLLAQGRRQLSSHWRRAGPALPVTIDRGKLTPDSDIRFWCCYSSRGFSRSTVWKSDSLSLQAPSMQDLQTAITNNPALSTDPCLWALSTGPALSQWLPPLCSPGFLTYFLLTPLCYHDLFVFFLILFLLCWPLFAALDKMSHIPCPRK